MKKFLLNIWYTILFQFDNHRNDIPEWWYADKPFEMQPAWRQRVLIAEDVIKQVRSRTYNPTTGRYIEVLKTSDIDDNDSLKEKFENLISCRVCALGACFLSGVKYKNNFTFSELNSMSESSNFTGSKKVKNILSIFSPKQLLLIEAAFEMCSVSFFASFLEDAPFVTTTERFAAYDFGELYRNPDARIIAIMQNIIDNKGEFKP